jgi:uncharacterized delta-60 repeat protein
MMPASWFVSSPLLRPTSAPPRSRSSWRARAALSLLAVAGLLAWQVAVAGAAHPKGGVLDPSFGVGGKVTTQFDSGFDQATALVVQGDKLVVAGSGGDGDFALARYSLDGSLDPTFGAGGRVKTDFGPADQASALVMQGDRLVAAGFTLTFTETSLDVALARYQPDGSLDPNFGAGGQVITDFGGDDRATAAVALPGGKLVVAGFTISFAGQPDVILARYNLDGSLDPSFGAGGKVITNVPGIEEAFALAVQPDGKLVVAGIAGPLGFGDLNQNFALARYNADGSLDSGFGTEGTVETDIGGRTNDQANALVVLANGKLVAAGTAAEISGSSDAALARYNADGTLDRMFGPGGTVRTDIGSGDFDEAKALAVQADGRLVIAGFAVTEGNFDFALARYKFNGGLDRSFGVGGTVRTDFSGSTDSAAALAIQADGKLVAAGFAVIGGDADFAIARYVP